MIVILMVCPGSDVICHGQFVAFLSFGDTVMELDTYPSFFVTGIKPWLKQRLESTGVSTEII